jgi:hypothetical protein
VTVGEVDLGAGAEHLRAHDPAHGNVELGRSLRARLALVVLERLDRTV